MAKSPNKTQKKRLVIKGKGNAKKQFNDECFIFNKTGHLAKDNKGKQGNPVKNITQTSTTVIN